MTVYHKQNILGHLLGYHSVREFGNGTNRHIINEHNAKVLEQVSEMAYHTEQISGSKKPLAQYVLDKHYLRKHGKNAYYGQNNKEEML